MASGNIKHGMKGVYIGAFSDGPIANTGHTFDVVLYFVVPAASQYTSVYAFTCSQFAQGHLYFNRLISEAWEYDKNWKKLI